MADPVTIDARFIVNLKGRDFPTYPGVLDAATKAGLRSLTTTVLQVPSAENGGMAVVMARAEFEDGRVFEDVGDCSPLNTSPQLASAALRLASTRGKGRVLRDSINCGMTLLEELPDEETTAANGSGARTAARESPARRPAADPQRGNPRPRPAPDAAPAPPAVEVVEPAAGTGEYCQHCGQELNEKEISGCRRKPEWFANQILCRGCATEYRAVAERAKVPAAAAVV